MIKSENFMFSKTLQSKFRYFSIRFNREKDTNDADKLLSYELQEKSRNFINQKFVTKRVGDTEILVYFVCRNNDNFDWLRLLEDILKKYNVTVVKTENLNFDPLNQAN